MEISLGAALPILFSFAFIHINLQDAVGPSSRGRGTSRDGGALELHDHCLCRKTSTWSPAERSEQVLREGPTSIESDIPTSWLLQVGRAKMLIGVEIV